jgi:hypothetical protein
MGSGWACFVLRELRFNRSGKLRNILFHRYIKLKSSSYVVDLIKDNIK